MGLAQYIGQKKLARRLRRHVGKGTPETSEHASEEDILEFEGGAPKTGSMEISKARHYSTLKSHAWTDLADQSTEDMVDGERYRKLVTLPRKHKSAVVNKSVSLSEVAPGIQLIRDNLPPDPLLNTPFGMRRMTYADYTASGRSLKFIEEYLNRVIAPTYANTHTETSATGLQTTHAREEARKIIMQALSADPDNYELLFTGSGSTAAIAKVIALLGIHVPAQMSPFMNWWKFNLEAALGGDGKPLVLISHAEHHSNELMWRETIADVKTIPPDDETGSVDLDFLEKVLRDNQHKYKHIIGSFTAGSNVTGLVAPVGKIANLMHKYGGYVCFDYAGAGPYKRMQMESNSVGDNYYLDAIFLSPHKFVGGPGTPGILCIRKEFANLRNGESLPPTVAGGGTVTMVWPENAGPDAESHIRYEKELHVREEAGTPGVMESIRCGLAFHVRDNLVGIDLIEELESSYAQRAVERMQAKKIWVMGDTFSGITSPERLSITSFNIWCSPKKLGHEAATTLTHPKYGHPLMLHPNFVAALLNDLYGIQSRSGAACAGPLSYRLFHKHYTFLSRKGLQKISETDERRFFAFKPGFCRVNFNYFIPEEEFDYIMSAIEQIAEHGWKLLPLYALTLSSGQYWYNGVHQDEFGHLVSFNRFDAIRRLKEVQVDRSGSVTWYESPTSTEDRMIYLKQAMGVYNDAPNLVRKMLFRFRNLRRKDREIPEDMEEYRYFAQATEVIPFLGITQEEIKHAQSVRVPTRPVRPTRTPQNQKDSNNDDYIPLFRQDRACG